MDLSSPLVTFMRPGDAAVLHALCRTDESVTVASLKESIEAYGGTASRDSVRRVLERLADQGLVFRTAFPGVTIYQLNPRHLVADAVLSVVRSPTLLADRIRADLEQWRPAVRHASIVGAAAARSWAALARSAPLSGIAGLAALSGLRHPSMGQVEPPDLPPPRIDDDAIEILVVGDSRDVVADPAWDVFASLLCREVTRWTGDDARLIPVTLPALAAMKEEQSATLREWTRRQVPLVGPSIQDLLEEWRGGQGQAALSGG